MASHSGYPSIAALHQLVDYLIHQQHSQPDQPQVPVQHNPFPSSSPIFQAQTIATPPPKRKKLADSVESAGTDAAYRGSLLDFVAKTFDETTRLNSEVLRLISEVARLSRENLRLQTDTSNQQLRNRLATIESDSQKRQEDPLTASIADTSLRRVRDAEAGSAELAKAWKNFQPHLVLWNDQQSSPLNLKDEFPSFPQIRPMLAAPFKSHLERILRDSEEAVVANPCYSCILGSFDAEICPVLCSVLVRDTGLRTEESTYLVLTKLCRQIRSSSTALYHHPVIQLGSIPEPGSGQISGSDLQAAGKSFRALWDENAKTHCWSLQANDAYYPLKMDFSEDDNAITVYDLTNSWIEDALKAVAPFR
ncbi:hypothetical protein IAU59_007612 [Kwoniella sp. CBS 9459]